MISDILYSRCDTYVRNALNTLSDFNTLSEQTLLDTLQDMVTEQSNPWVYRIKFADLTQHDSGEDIQSFFIRLQQNVLDCEYVCPNSVCKQDLSEEHIKHQFIKGLANKQLQTDILAKAKSLDTLQKVLEHAKAFEAALRDQTSVSKTMNDTCANISRLRVSDYRRNKRSNSNTMPKPSFTCRCCGNKDHRPWDKDSQGKFKCKAKTFKCKKCHKVGSFYKHV